MKKILILGAGGSPATNFVRSLKSAPEPFYQVGTDCNKYYLMRAETDKKYFVPPASDSSYLDVLNEIIVKENIDFVHAQNDTEVSAISTLRDKIKAKTFLPSEKTVSICQDKYKSFELWERAGLPQPKTFFISNEFDLLEAFKAMKKIWLREISGAGGKGSLPTEDYEQAKAWIDFNKGWGRFIAAEYLSPDSITWQSIWNKGRLIVAQTRKRLYWELGKISPSGVSGATGGAVTVSDNRVDRSSIKAIKAIDSNPNGIFSVDMTYDKNGVPVVTELNISRFFTTHEFFTKAGLNMPYIYIKVAFNENFAKIKKRINPLPDGLVWIRGIDFLPILTTMDEINKYEK